MVATGSINIVHDAHVYFDNSYTKYAHSLYRLRTVAFPKHRI